MLENNEVNNIDSEMKAFLLEWLLNHGREPMWKHIASGHVSGVKIGRAHV